MAWVAVAFGLAAAAHADPNRAPPDPPSAASAAPMAGEPAILEGAVDAGRYVVGPGDRLRLELWGLQDLRQEIEVAADGRLFVPRAGVFDAGGTTLEALRTAVGKRLHALYPRLQSSLTLVQPRDFVVHVTGAVARPGSYVATPLLRVSALLPRAGGALPSGSLRRVEIRRRGAARPIIADLVRFSALGELDADPPLLDGDTVYVPARQRTVEISGGVRRPGRYELIDGTLAELLELAGGLGSDAARSRPLRIASRGGSDRVAVRSADAGQAASIQLDDGDRVHVPELVEVRPTITISGAVRGPHDGDDPVAAPRPNSRDNQPDAAPREVSVSLPWTAGAGVRDVLGQAGGLQPWADAQHAYLWRRDGEERGHRIPVDLVAISTGAGADVPVVAGDALVVPSRREQVLVGGAVQHPGYYPYASDLKPRDYLSLAGGPTRSGNAGGARVLQNGVSHRLDKVPSIAPGDVITVPEHTFTAADWTTISLVVGNIVIGAVAVGLAARH
jgi:protein involved in polysaccharide export with SLBB domain